MAHQDFAQNERKHCGMLLSSRYVTLKEELSYEEKDFGNSALCLHAGTDAAGD